MPVVIKNRNAQIDEQFPADDVRAAEKAIRRIVRANDLRSRALVKATGLTGAQLVILKAIAALGEVTTTRLSAHADLSPATVITILDKLEERGSIERYRSRYDRRVVHTRLTAKGAALVANAPEPLGRAFVQRLMCLDMARRRQLIAAVTEFADLLSTDQSEAAPQAPDSVS